MSRRESKHKSGRKAAGKVNKDGELFVFGYASKLFRDDRAADFHDKEKHLISWQGDSSLQIDRYDCRLLFTDKSQFDFDLSKFSEDLSLQEQEIEQQCDEERYLELTTDMVEYDIEQEEEMKRFKEAISQDNGYSAVGFSYNNDASTDNSMDATEQPINQVQGPAPQPVEKFIAPDELGVPDGMRIPDTAKMNAIIERTAMFVSEQGAQMEILVKAKQAGNPQFDFLNFDNWLNPYYKHVLTSIKEKTYIPQMVQSPKPEDNHDSEPESDDDDDSDGEFELHPLLTASHRSASNTPNSSAPSSPAPQSTEEHTGYPNTGRTDVHGHYSHNNGADGHHDNYHWTGHGYNNYYHGSDYSGIAVSTNYMSTQHTSTSTLAAASLLPPPPPPPGEGPVEDEWSGHISSPSHGSAMIHPVTTGVPAIIPGHPALVMAAAVHIVPPPPDVQPIIDKLANYVAKNGNDFESIIKAKNDPRFTFVHTWHEHHRYYLYKKQLCVEVLEKEKKAALAKGPISFSIKSKDVQKPKIEYRSNVIYKQSVDPEESEDEETKENEMEENGNGNGNTNEGNGSVDREVEKEDNFLEERFEEDQTQSIQAAEKEAQRLEAESQVQREKQLQEERRRKASLFISMLKKTKGPEGNPQDSEETNNHTKRRFTERKRSSDTSVDMFEDKRPRNEEHDSLATTGAGAPPADIIRITQDLMAKVRAASRTKR